MKYENSITIIIFLLIVDLFFYFITSISTIKAINVYGRIISIIVFAIVLLGLFIASSREKKTLSRFYYISLFVISLIILIFQLVSIKIGTIVHYYFILAVLIALLLSLLDLRVFFLTRAKAVINYRLQASKTQKDMDKLQTELQKQKDITETYKEEVKKRELTARRAREMAVGMEKKASKTARELKKKEKHIAQLNRKAAELREKTKKLAEDKKKTANLRKSQELLERKLKRSKKEIERQAELKSQYSKTLRRIRKRKKEEEELLVVSPDGKSVHRPKCIAVRHVSKEHRKLVKNWKTAEKKGYKGCKLCKPHIKPKVVVKGRVKYRLVVSKISDKIHKVSCTLVRNIRPKDREYFRTYKAALKKGYTACRICNPGE